MPQPQPDDDLTYRAIKRWDLALPGLLEYIYVFSDESNRVKLGRSDNPAQRLRKLQTGNAEQLTLTAVFPGSPAVERAFHALLEDAHIRGEWFRRTPKVEAVITLIHGISEQLYWPCLECDKECKCRACLRVELLCARNS